MGLLGSKQGDGIAAKISSEKFGHKIISVFLKVKMLVLLMKKRTASSKKPSVELKECSENRTCLSAYQDFTFSLKSLPALKAGTFVAGIFSFFPV